MKNKNIFLLAVLFTIAMMFIFTYVFSNLWMMITDHTNYIPKESNVFFFQPTQIDDGSGGYWRYGEDLKYFYYFSEEEQNVYYSYSKENNCENFNKIDISTWCQVMKHHH